MNFYGRESNTGVDWIKLTSANVSTGIVVDLNGDGCVEFGEISSYINLWLSGQVTFSEVSSAISLWISGVGC